MAKLTRDLKLGNKGLDVEAAKRSTYRYLAKLLGGKYWAKYLKQSQRTKAIFGPVYRQDLIKAQKLLAIKRDRKGVFGQHTLDALEKVGAVDDVAEKLFEVAAKPKPQQPKLVEPKQGWNSLHHELWDEYSIGRNMGMSDLGTYNPASRLPSGAPSDHSVYPAWAFDLGISPQNGFDNPTGRKFFNLMVGRPGIHYVILGDKIWSTDKGLHAYTDGGHENHVHTSGAH